MCVTAVQSVRFTGWKFARVVLMHNHKIDQWYQKLMILAYSNIAEGFAATFLVCLFHVTLLPLAVNVPISSTATVLNHIPAPLLN